jgi:hypothetical protein
MKPGIRPLGRVNPRTGFDNYGRKRFYKSIMFFIYNIWNNTILFQLLWKKIVLVSSKEHRVRLTSCGMGITLSLITNCKERRVKLMLESCEFYLFIYVKQCPVNYETMNHHEPKDSDIFMVSCAKQIMFLSFSRWLLSVDQSCCSFHGNVLETPDHLLL